MHALLIEDDPALQRATARVIQSTFPGCEVEVVDTANGAIARIRGMEYALIVSDYDLYKGSGGNESGTGGDVLSWIETDRPDLGGRFVFFSGNDRTLDIHDRCAMKGETRIPDLREIFRRAANQ